MAINRLRVVMGVSMVGALLISATPGGSADVALSSAVISQIGLDIDGKATNELFGTSVAISDDGTRFIAGGIQIVDRFDRTLTATGVARVYDVVNGNWVQVGGDIPGVAARELFGYSVAISSDGSIVAISAPAYDEAQDSKGHVRVFTLIGNSWQQLGPTIVGDRSNDESGDSVSLSADGSRLAVGTMKNDGVNNDQVSIGNTRIYDWNGSTWVLDDTIYGEAAGDGSGKSVSLTDDGTIIAIGAPNNDGGGNFSGHVRVYEDSGSGWIQRGADIDGVAVEDYFGASVSLSADGNRLAAGGPGNDDGGNSAGHVRVFDWDGSQWNQVGSAINGEAAEDDTGSEVSISSDGRRLALGAQFNDGVGNNAGHVRVFELARGDWYQVGPDIDGEAASDQWGRSVSLDATGSVLAAGGWANDGGASNGGHVRVYSIGALTLPSEPSNNTGSNSDRDSTPGVFLTVPVEPGDSASQVEVIVGAYAVNTSSPYSVSLRSEGSVSRSAVVSSGRMSAGGNLERQITLPPLPAGRHTITLTAQATNGGLLVLGNTLTVSAQGTIVSVTPERQQPFVR